MYKKAQTPSQIGQAVRITRKSLNITQQQLALAAGVGVRFVVELEAGKPSVRLEHTLRVLDTLGLDLYLGGIPSQLEGANTHAPS